MNATGRWTSSSFDSVRLALGLTLVALGALFLAGQSDLVSAGAVVRAGWPSVLIGYGALHYLSSRHRASALFVMALGAVLLLFTLDIVPGSPLPVAASLLLIVAGIWLLLGRRRFAGAAADDTVFSYSLFGDNELTRRSRDFTGGTIVEVFGDMTLDLRSADLAENGARIDVLAVFSDMTIRVPHGWRVALSGIPVLSEYSDKTGHDGPLPADAPLLIINVFTLFSDLKVSH